MLLRNSCAILLDMKNSGTTHKKTYDFLKHHPFGVLSTIAETGNPWGSAIYFIVDEKLNFFFVTRVDTLKYSNLIKNPESAITVSDEKDQVTVQATGSVTRIPADESLDIIFNELEKTHPVSNGSWVPPIIKVHKGNYVVLQFTPRYLQYADYKNISHEPGHQHSEVIIGS
jgi:uncharacterized pyridoxamine 5'-phosphate oxidase family protein